MRNESTDEQRITVQKSQNPKQLYDSGMYLELAQYMRDSLPIDVMAVKLKPKRGKLQIIDFSEKLEPTFGARFEYLNKDPEEWTTEDSGHIVTQMYNKAKQTIPKDPSDPSLVNMIFYQTEKNVLLTLEDISCPQFTKGLALQKKALEDQEREIREENLKKRQAMREKPVSSKPLNGPSEQAKKEAISAPKRKREDLGQIHRPDVETSKVPSWLLKGICVEEGINTECEDEFVRVIKRCIAEYKIATAHKNSD